MGEHDVDWGNICMGYWIHLGFGFTMLSADTLGVESARAVHQSGKAPVGSFFPGLESSLSSIAVRPFPGYRCFEHHH